MIKLIVGFARFVLGLVVGAALYIPLTLAPIIGPLFAGYTSGRIAKTGVTTGILLGFLSSCMGFLAWIYFIYPRINSVLDSTLSWVFLWVFVIWNITSIVFMIAGAVISGIQNMADKIKIAPHSRSEEDEQMSTEFNVTNTFIVCPNCGCANLEDKEKCDFCGTQIK
jgi:ABC-type transport system involved in multi-copper enzyme maturation permease subunit